MGTGTGTPPGITAITPATSGPLGGVDIYVSGRSVNRKGNTILVYNGDALPLSEYAATSAGLTAALAAAGSGDVVWLAPGDYTDSYTVPAGVGMVTMDNNAALSGPVNLGASSYLKGVTIDYTASSADAIAAVTGPASGTAILNDCHVECTNTGAGNAYAVQVGNGDVMLWECWVEGTASGGGDGYGIYGGNGDCTLVGEGYPAGSAGPVYGDNIARTTLDALVQLHNASDAVMGVYAFTSAGLDLALAAAVSGDVILLPAGTIDGDHTVPAGVEVVGRGRENTVLSGQITLGDGAVLRNLSVTRTASQAGDLIGVVAPASGMAYVVGCDIQVENATGDGFACYGDLENLTLRWCSVTAQSGGVDDNPFWGNIEETITNAAHAGVATVNGLGGYTCDGVISQTVGATTYQAMVFWNSSDKLTFAVRDITSPTWTIYATAISLGTDDTHHFASLGIDPDGYLHVAYDMHASALKYRRSTQPVNAFDGTLTAALSMLGTNETEVTYPKFFNAPDGTLYFMFRDGTAGFADEFFYVYNKATTTWSAAPGTAAGGKFIDGWNSPGYESPYLFNPVFDASGDMHLLFFWRAGSGGVNNHDIRYVRWDGTSFYQIGGGAQTIPITTSNDDGYDVALGSYLTLGAMDVDGDGHPHVVFGKIDGASDMQNWHLWHNGTSWVLYQLSSASGTGTEPSWAVLSNPDMVIDRGTNTVYVYYGDDTLGEGLWELRSDPGDYTTWTTTRLSRADFGSYNPYHDRLAWERDGEVYTPIAEWWTGGSAWEIYMLTDAPGGPYVQACTIPNADGRAAAYPEYGDRGSWRTDYTSGAAHADDWAAGDSHHPAVTLGAGSAEELSLSGQELTLAEVLTPTEHTAIGNSAPHHAPVTLGGGSDPALSLSGQQLTLADVLTPVEHDARDHSGLPGIASGTYRQFTYVPDGAGSFSFVVDGDGMPVFAQLDLEE